MFQRRRGVLRVLAILLLLLMIAGGATSAGVWLWANHHFHAAEQAFQHNRLAEARGHIELCLKAWPNSGPAHFLAGRAARRVLDFKQATKHFEECARLQGKSQPLTIEYMLMHVQQGEVDRAEAYFQREVANGNPDSPLILEAFVQGYMRLDRLPDVDACLRRWENLQPDNMYLYLLRGSIRERIPNVQAAADDYRKVLDLNPDYEEAHLRLARVLLSAHEPDEALTHLLHLRDVQPGNTTVLVLLARCYLELTRPEEVRPLLAEALSQDPRNQPALLVSAQLAMQEGTPEEAENLLRQALAIDQYDREANFLLSQCLRQRGKQAEAEQQQARFKRIEDDWKALHEIRTKRMGVSPHDPELQYQAGVILLRLGEEKEGVEWLKRALAADPKHEPSHKALAEYYQRIGDSRQAANHRSTVESSRSAVPGTYAPSIPH